MKLSVNSFLEESILLNLVCDKKSFEAFLLPDFRTAYN